MARPARADISPHCPANSSPRGSNTATPFGTRDCRQRSILRHGHIPRLGVLGDVALGSVARAVDVNRRQVGIVGRNHHAMIRHQNGIASSDALFPATLENHRTPLVGESECTGLRVHLAVAAT